MIAKFVSSISNDLDKLSIAVESSNYLCVGSFRLGIF